MIALLLIKQMKSMCLNTISLDRQEVDPDDGCIPRCYTLCFSDIQIPMIEFQHIIKIAV